MFWQKKVRCPSCKGSGVCIHSNGVGENSQATHEWISGCTRCGGSGNDLTKSLAARVCEQEYGGLSEGSGEVPYNSLNDWEKEELDIENELDDTLGIGM